MLQTFRNIFLAISKKPTAFVRGLFGAIAMILCLGSCSQYSTGRVPVAYHNLTARFNAYVIARDKLQLAEQQLAAERKDTYTRLLPILEKLDSTKTILARPLLEDAIKKASTIADRHQNSKWLDHAYNIIGHAKLYRQKFDEAIETFKYINTKGQNIDQKHHALVGLMRGYLETEDYTAALNVAEYLRQQRLNEKNTVDYYLTKAALHQRRGEYKQAVGILDATFGGLKKNEETARLHFIAGQLHDVLGNYQKANDHYALVEENRPAYDLEFFANMNAVQNEAFTGKNSTQLDLNQMLADRKNSDLKDRIFYTMGVIETRKANYPLAVSYFQQSVKETTTNTVQIPYTYLELAQLHYDKLQKYELAQAYYDSTLALLPKDIIDYQRITERRKTLDDFVKQLTVVRTEDSLQRLANMNPVALDQLLDEVLEKQIDEEVKRQALAQKLLSQAKQNQANNYEGDLAERFSLYDPVATSRGKIDFKQKWGNRILEDDWRRSSREKLLNNTPDKPKMNGEIVAIGESGDFGKIKKGSPEWKARKDALLLPVPLRQEEKDQSNKRIEEALYRLGKIYKFELGEPANSASTFERLVAQHPKTEFRAESYYLLYLLTESTPKQAFWKDKLQTEFPGASYTRLMLRNASGVSAGSDADALRAYSAVYDLYQASNYSEAKAKVEDALLLYAGSQIEDRFAVLNVFLVGKIRGKEDYIKALNEFAKNYPTSALLPRMKEILEVFQPVTAKRKD